MRKVRLYFGHDDKKTVKEWFGACRATYNNALEGVKENEDPVNLVELRKLYVNSDAMEDGDRYLLRTPKHVRDGALMDLTGAYSSNRAKRRINPRHHFDVKYRTKKDEMQSVFIPAAAIKLARQRNQLRIYPKSLLNVIQCQMRSLPEDINYDCRLTMDRMGRFHLCIPILF